MGLESTFFYNLVVTKFRSFGLFLNLHLTAYKLKILMMSCPPPINIITFQDISVKR